MSPKDADEPVLPAGTRWLQGRVDRAQQRRILADLRVVLALAPPYVPMMPRTGKPLSVQMTNCGILGWLTDKDGGYRYQATHPLTHRPWPDMPESLLRLWREVAEYPALPEACLINLYAGTARMGSHRDADEKDVDAPVVSLSLGDDAVFHVGGLKRSDPKVRITLRSGDVLILGGASRLAYHGIDRLLPGTSDLLSEGGRINVTLRRVTRS